MDGLLNYDDTFIFMCVFTCCTDATSHYRQEKIANLTLEIQHRCKKDKYLQYTQLPVYQVNHATTNAVLTFLQ